MHLAAPRRTTRAGPTATLAQPRKMSEGAATDSKGPGEGPQALPADNIAMDRLRLTEISLNIKCVRINFTEICARLYTRTNF